MFGPAAILRDFNAPRYGKPKVRLGRPKHADPAVADGLSLAGYDAAVRRWLDSGRIGNRPLRNGRAASERLRRPAIR